MKAYAVLVVAGVSAATAALLSRRATSPATPREMLDLDWDDLDDELADWADSRADRAVYYSDYPRCLLYVNAMDRSEEVIAEDFGQVDRLSEEVALGGLIASYTMVKEVLTQVDGLHRGMEEVGVDPVIVHRVIDGLTTMAASLAERWYWSMAVHRVGYLPHPLDVLPDPIVADAMGQDWLDGDDPFEGAPA